MPPPSPSRETGSPVRGGESPDPASASHVDSMTNMDSDIEMEDLEHSKTCEDNCCDHSQGCNCGGCFCQVRTDIQINANQTTYSKEGGHGHGVTIVYGELSTDANNDDGVAALGARLASLNTDVSSSLPIDIAPRGLRPDSLIAPPSFDALRERDAHQSYEEHMWVNIQRLGLGIDDDMKDTTDFDQPGVHFNYPRSECELMFEFESNDLSRFNSHELPPDMFALQSPHVSSRNASMAVRGAGGLFDTISMTNRSQFSLEMPVCFDPLQLVPDCRHGRAAGCA